ncbi:hypothetical protein OGAPHI_006669 [Ogataea philodendri]|uniref:Nuclear condensin complex subunit 3 C-terminal domain-containing protein n=1 Tax=Ogataea philodendri TaxID=1378263 RepID=A0A9P8NX95_9ASCO|nr:uncharacterized protein OGAPHI_006669 [Ogataea philodendri]KAH3661262.1 hypothetical protein OGAPHI_006669 [Ogataea philodendri]
MAEVVTKPAVSSRTYLKSLHELSQPDQIERAIRQSFQESQQTVSSHGKQIAILRALQLRCRELTLQSQFNELFCKMVNKILVVKRNEPAGDRIVKFISSFVNSINPESDDDNAMVDEQDEKMYNRFIDRVARHLLRGLEATNKNVRYRSCHILSHLMNNMTSIDSSLYETLSEQLLARMYDKEPHVRIKAITTLASFQEPDGSDELSNAAQKIRFVMQNDTNPEVRRACLRQIEKTKHTQSYIFERARDTNSINRRLLYSKVLPGFKDFRRIDFNSRDQLLKWGLKDREESVKKAAVKWLSENWMQTLNNDVMELLERLKVTRSDIAELAVRNFLDNRPDIVAKITFDEQVIRSLTPETSLLLRVYFQHCNDTNKLTQLEKFFPEAAQFSDILGAYFTKRREIMSHISQTKPILEAESSVDMTELEECNFMLRQLLIVASEYDYSDEFGRSRMLNTLRFNLTNDHLSDDLIEVIMLCIHKLSISERDFTQMIVEIINDLKDSAFEKQDAANQDINGESSRLEGAYEDEDEDEDDEDGESSFHSARANLSKSSIASANRSMQQELRQVEELSPEILTECLSIARRMLELVSEPLKNNVTLMSILDSLIRPSIRRSETEIRRVGLICLGLCCILDKDLAADSIFVCAIFVTKSNEESLIVTGIKVISDLLAVHGIGVLEAETANSVDAIAIARLFYRTLRDTTKKEAQATSGEALYKLFLCGVITDDELFETTLLSYFNPAINDNEQLKQCLSFCIPVYAFSHESHQERISRVTSDTLYRLFSAWDEMAEVETVSQLSPQSIIQQLMYWTDPYRVVNKNSDEALASSIQVDVGLQLLTLLGRLEYSGATKPFFKAIMTSLPKLTFTEHCDAVKLAQLLDALEEVEGKLEKPLKDQTSRNGYNRFKEYVEDCLEKAGGRREEAAEEEAGEGQVEEEDVQEEEDEGEADEEGSEPEKPTETVDFEEPVLKEDPESHLAELGADSGTDEAEPVAKKTKPAKSAKKGRNGSPKNEHKSDKKSKKPKRGKRVKSESEDLLATKVTKPKKEKKVVKKPKAKKSAAFSDSEDEQPISSFQPAEDSDQEVGDTSAIVFLSDDE